MITITKNGNAVLFEFEENQHYLYNGTIEVPLNSLSLVTDESEMFTFKKAATNDIFISARYDDVNMSKSQLIDFYIANMVGGGGSESGITSGDVESMISASLEDYYDIDEVDAALSGKADTSAVTEAINSAVSGKADSSAVTQEISAAVSGKQDTLIAGSGITISGNVISAEGGNLVIELTQAEYDALVTGGTVDLDAFYIITDATEINISDYYTSAQTQSAITAATNALAEAIAEQHYQTSGDVQNAISGKADTSSVYTKSEVDTALSGKQDVSGMTAYTTSSDVESYVSGFTYDKATIDSKVASGGTFDPTNYYDKTATDALLDDKFDASAFTSYSAATDARMAEDEEVTAAALNALNDELSGKADSSDVIAALSGKQDTLVAGDNITISGNVISADGGGKAVSGGTNISITTGETADTINCTLPISAGTGSQSIIAATQPNYPSKATANGAIAFNGYGFHPTSASGVNSLAQGSDAEAQGDASHAEGNATYAIGFASHSEGNSTSAMTDYSHAEGVNTKTTNKYEHASGILNISISASTTFGNSGNTLFSVGNGYNNSNRHNAFEIRQNGDIYIADTNDTSTSNYYEKPMIKLQDALGGGGGVSESAFTSYSAATDARMAEDEEVTAAALNALNDKFDGLRLKKLTEAEYSALVTKDNSTLYVIVN